ncbi:phage tail family protein [Streptomyces jumonjinensis]|uniref:Phage tail protein n=1 Tax=Streptomyces jumonjinensis TaxID=1945 RepID=A0A646KSX9_STRJU|nr:phage tail domain-containing protein [Streptomyces jumonjinensis]MQT05432.1 hypothetical protein [Streptomyces jumonjinensis]
MSTPPPRIELAPWQYEIGGVVLGTGTPIPVADVEGLGAPTVRAQDTDNPVGDGVLPGQDFYAARTVRIEAGIKTPGDPTAAADLLARLHKALDDPAARTSATGRAVLRGRWPGHNIRRLYGRLRRVEAVSTAQARHGWIPLDIEFAATLDTRWHADESSRLVLPLDQTPRREGDTPQHCDEHADPDDRPGWITNHGNATAWPSLRIHGPAANPRVWNTATGQSIELALTLRSGEWVELETRPGTRWALRNGVTNVATDLVPPSRLDRFILPPGRSEISWSADDATGSSRLEVNWRSAYTSL